MNKINFYDYYYYSDLIICSFCLEYIISYFDIINQDEEYFFNTKYYYYYLNNYYFIIGNFNIICTDCIVLCNNIMFLNNYILYKNNNNIDDTFDFYDEYFECYKNCFTCYLFYIDYFYYYRHSDNDFCEFEKDYFYYEINYFDYYEFYKYCYNLKCKCCFKFFFLNSNLCQCFEDLVYYKFKNKEINTYYDFYFKEEEDIFEIISPEEIYLFLNKFVVGQEKAKKLVSVSIYNHYKKIKLNLDLNLDLPKSNILMIGPSGCGKTFLMKTISRIIDIPVVLIDATTLTEAGYVGEDVDSMVQKLYNESFYNINMTEIGIIFIDEIDKISSKGFNLNKDISGEGVQQALLKIIEGSYCTVAYENEYGEQFFFTIITDNILFICGGAFPSINIEEDYDEKKSEKFVIFDTEPLINFGLIPELVGRLSLIIKFNNLDIFFLKETLTGSESSLISYYNNLFIPENVKLKILDGSVKTIINMSLKKGVGTRGLRNVIDNILLDIMYKMPIMDNLNEIIIHNYIFYNDSNGPLLKYEI
ncbi:AAA family ATPase [Candidatus Nasuia deltocephalinicola]|uniref:AAA family ATPase n=1 Tax=Candidatus Nasuia deltocephalincola TaxID=1160784 RepID=UPI00216B1DA9|nr:AAA family ATPase [Candidatus Nasuia deltocephalinicola]